MPASEQPRLQVVDGRSYGDWEAVYRDNVVPLYKLIFRRVGNAPDAEDLAQEVLVRTLRSLRFPAPVREVRSYLVKTARSVLSEHWRVHYGGREDVVAINQLEGERALESEPPTSETVARAIAIL